MSETRYFDRELSWLSFNRRVLEEACNPANPLLERIRFMVIFTSNLDEFFMKRVGALSVQEGAPVVSSDLQSLVLLEQLNEIRNTVLPLVKTQSDHIVNVLVPELEKEGISLVKWAELCSEDTEWLNAFFYKNYFPILTPLAVDEGHPFPFISNLSVSLGIMMRNPAVQGEELFARLKIPAIFSAWIPLPVKKGETVIRFVSAYELIGNNLGILFPGMEILSVMAFRLTRNADVERDEEEADDLLEMVAEELRVRRFAEVVRLEYGPNPDPRIVKILMDELQLQPEDVYENPIWLEYFQLGPIADLKKAKLHFTPWAPVPPPSLADQESNIFEMIRANDILVHHPFESFTASVERFIRTASEDPNVIAIKMTLYRTGEDSPFIPYLIRAAEAGKQVAVLVELQARFDEERNILVAQALEKAGVHVVYGIVGLKTHCKIALVVRKEGRSVRSYVHIGTGNYHSRTALTYTDLGLFTVKADFTEDIIHLFHYLTGRSLHWKFKKLLVAPIDMRASFIRMIEREAEQVKKGLEAHVVVKLNNLEDPEIIESLYQASQNGVKVDLIIRSICCLRPGVKGLSENIRVFSIVGRFLEHSRVFYFRNAAKNPEDGEIFLGSADWMQRNLSARVEAVVPIEDPAARKRIWEMLQVFLNDQKQAWELDALGNYTRRQGAADSISAQEVLMKAALKSKNRFPGESPAE